MAEPGPVFVRLLELAKCVVVVRVLEHARHVEARSAAGTHVCVEAKSDVCVCVCIMFIDVYIYIYICIYTHTHTHTHTQIHIYIYSCICRYAAPPGLPGGGGGCVDLPCPSVRLVLACQGICVYVCMCICMYVHMNVCVYVCMCICMYVHANKNIIIIRNQCPGYLCSYACVSCVYVCMYVCMYTYVCMYVCASEQKYHDDKESEHFRNFISRIKQGSIYQI